MRPFDRVLLCVMRRLAHTPSARQAHPPQCSDDNNAKASLSHQNRLGLLMLGLRSEFRLSVEEIIQRLEQNNWARPGSRSVTHLQDVIIPRRAGEENPKHLLLPMPY